MKTKLEYCIYISSGLSFNLLQGLNIPRIKDQRFFAYSIGLMP